MVISLPFTVIRAKRGLGAFRHCAERLHPCRLRGVVLRICHAAVNGLTPDFRHQTDVGRAALATFNLHRGNISGQQFRQQFQRVEAGGFFQRVITLAVNQIAAFAQRRVASVFTVLIAVNQYLIQARFQPCGVCCQRTKRAGEQAPTVLGIHRLNTRRDSSGLQP